MTLPQGTAAICPCSYAILYGIRSKMNSRILLTMVPVLLNFILPHVCISEMTHFPSQKDLIFLLLHNRLTPASSYGPFSSQLISSSSSDTTQTISDWGRDVWNVFLPSWCLFTQKMPKIKVKFIIFLCLCRTQFFLIV